MRCISCNKSIGTLFMVRIHEDYICKKCLKDKGFTKKELQELPYWLQSWEYLKDGKDCSGQDPYWLMLKTVYIK